jgi:hypothetical protein
MKIGTTAHPKFRSLMRELDLPQYSVVGLLESIWMLAAQFTDDGDVSRFSAVEIADYAGYDGDAESLVESLIQCRWLDRIDDRLLIHDWEDHLPYFIYERRKKRNQRSKQKSDEPTSETSVPASSRDKLGKSDLAQSSPVNTSLDKESANACVSVWRKCPEGVNEQHWRDWLAIRRKKKATNTQTAWDAFAKQVAISGLPVGEIIQRCAEEGWSGFKAMWVTDGRTRSGAEPTSTSPHEAKKTQAAIDRKKQQRLIEPKVRKVVPA